MLLRRTPQLTDDLIMAQNRPGGLAVGNTQKVLAAHGAYQTEQDRINEARQSSLDLSRQRLEQGSRFFDENLAFDRKSFENQKSDAMTSNIIGGLGIAAAGYGNYKQGQRDAAYQAQLDKYRSAMLSNYETEQDLWNEILKRLRSQNG